MQNMVYKNQGVFYLFFRVVCMYMKEVSVIHDQTFIKVNIHIPNIYYIYIYTYVLFICQTLGMII